MCLWASPCSICRMVLIPISEPTITPWSEGGVTTSKTPSIAWGTVSLRWWERRFHVHRSWIKPQSTYATCRKEGRPERWGSIHSSLLFLPSFPPSFSLSPYLPLIIILSPSPFSSFLLSISSSSLSSSSILSLPPFSSSLLSLPRFSSPYLSLPPSSSSLLSLPSLPFSSPSFLII